MCLKPVAAKEDIILPYLFHVLRGNKRISGRSRIESVMKEGDRLKGRSILMLRKENSLDSHCFGVIVSKKVHKSAVKRNRLRRQIYEIIRILNKEGIVPKGPSSDIVLLARRALMGKDFSAIQKEIRILFTQSHDR